MQPPTPRPPAKTAAPLNIAHRGGAGLWPENTLFAFEQAAAAGFDGAELDVQLSRDGKLVVFHDYRLKPELCRNSEGRWIGRGERRLTRELDAAKLRQYDVGRIKPRTLYGQRHRVLHPRDGERIPLLADVIIAVRKRRADFKLFIEIKTCPEDRALSSAPEAVADGVIEMLRQASFVEHAVLVGFDWAALLHAKMKEPGLACWFSTKRRSPRADRSWAAEFHPSKFGGSFADAIRRAGGDGWLCSRVQATRSRIEEARGVGLKFGVWTVNDARSMRGFSQLGVDAIVSDRPDLLASVLTSQAFEKSR